LVRYFKLPDTNAHIRRFAKIELTPVDWMDAATWTWRIDEPTRPNWLDEVEAEAERKTRAIADRMIVRDGEHGLIVDGCWIIGGTAKIRDVRSGRIVRVQDSAQIHDVRGSAQIHDVRGSAQIHDVRGSAQIHDVGDSAQIHGVWDSAQIHDVWGSAQIHDVRGSAQIHDVRGSAQIHDVRGSAQIHDVWGSALLDTHARARVVKP
jgi:hypothetical protein